mmetsp:Transcript_14621/g.25958  ORF Transcript_14621/g.25958 Transcript_14621/m.25958 type:complete len:128 (-) Transcript_14621:578-961(-)
MLRSTAVIAGGAVSLVRFNARLASRARVLACLVAYCCHWLGPTHNSHSASAGLTVLKGSKRVPGNSVERSSTLKQTNKTTASNSVPTMPRGGGLVADCRHTPSGRFLQVSGPVRGCCCAALHCIALH